MATVYEQCLDLAIETIGEFSYLELSGQKIHVFSCKDARIKRPEDVFFERQKKFSCLDAITIGRSSKHVLLQCADLGAWMLRKSWGAIAVDDPKVEHLASGRMPRGIGQKQRLKWWSQTPEHSWRAHGM